MNVRYASLQYCNNLVLAARLGNARCSVVFPQNKKHFHCSSFPLGLTGSVVKVPLFLSLLYFVIFKIEKCLSIFYRLRKLFVIFNKNLLHSKNEGFRRCIKFWKSISYQSSTSFSSPFKNKNNCMIWRSLITLFEMGDYHIKPIYCQALKNEELKILRHMCWYLPTIEFFHRFLSKITDKHFLDPIKKWGLV